MDPISFTASIIAVVTISEAVLSSCWQYLEKARNAQKDVKKILDVVGSLKSILEHLKRLADSAHGNELDPRLPLLSALAVPNGPLMSCEAILQELEKKLGPAPKSFGLKAMKWPFKENAVNEIVETIEKHKSTIILALSGDSLQSIRVINDGVEQLSTAVENLSIKQDEHAELTTAMTGSISAIGDSMQNRENDDKRRRVINWLEGCDSSTNHHAARAKHEPGTGNWLVASEQYNSWLKKESKFLWIHGIPGAGKTVLCSTVIKHIIVLCGTTPSYEYAYFYFDFKDQRKQTVAGSIRSLISQLCARRLVVPKEVESLYQQCDNGKREPGMQSLIETMILLFSSSDRMFLIIDALDECLDREEMCDILHQLVDRSSESLSLFVTSRKEHDINTALEETVHVEISIQTALVDEDIRLHVRECLNSDKFKLKSWNDSIKEEILASLVRGSHGM
jgi:NACHT domain/Fungal N-terminal domain of STAND proteins